MNQNTSIQVPKRVLVILPSFDSGGAENYALRLIEHSRSSKIEWHVTSGNLKNAQMEKQFFMAGASVHYASVGYGGLYELLQFYRFLKRYRFQAIMTLNGIFSGPSLKLAQLSGIPIRIAWHRRSTPAYKRTFSRRLYARMMHVLLNCASTAIMSNSAFALETFHGINWREDARCMVIRNGVDGARFQPRTEVGIQVRRELGIPQTASVFGHIGRFDPAKNHDTLLRAFAIIAQHDQNAWFILAGTGTDGDELEKLTAASGIGHRLACLGARTDIQRLYNAMDCFLFPSITEGQPNALIEAMLCGVPIAASDIPPIRETTPEWLHSDLFPPQDSKAASEKALHAVQTSRKALAETRAWACKKFDPNRNFDLVIKRLKP